MSSQTATDYFDFIANLGMTKHYGSLAATRELVDMCRIGQDSYVLDVGCGVGATPSILAKEVGCRVMGVDLLDKMVEQSRARAKADGIEDRVDFKVADARELPFEDDLFDAVISESVNIFFSDKQQAMREYVRVTKAGGYVGMTEMTWLKPPSPRVEQSFRDMVYAHALDASGWKEVLVGAGLVDVVGDAQRMDVSSESKGRLERYGGRGIVKVLLRMVSLMVRDRRARQFVRDGSGAVSKDLPHVVGFGVYAGRKA